MQTFGSDFVSDFSLRLVWMQRSPVLSKFYKVSSNDCLIKYCAKFVFFNSCSFQDFLAIVFWEKGRSVICKHVKVLDRHCPHISIDILRVPGTVLDPYNGTFRYITFIYWMLYWFWIVSWFWISVLYFRSGENEAMQASKCR